MIDFPQMVSVSHRNAQMYDFLLLLCTESFSILIVDVYLFFQIKFCSFS